jgi:chemotaxis protein MotB
MALNAEGARQTTELADLTSQLGTAEERYQSLNARVTALDNHRQGFLDSVRAALGDLPGVSIADTALILESDLVFEPRSREVELSRDGQARLTAVAKAVQAVSASIPADLDWVLRIEGHTDDLRLKRGSAYRNNWELSAERAITAVEYLIRQGVPGEHVSAVGRSQYDPLVPNDSEEARRQNRRLELILTAAR